MKHNQSDTLIEKIIEKNEPFSKFIYLYSIGIIIKNKYKWGVSINEKIKKSMDEFVDLMKKQDVKTYEHCRRVANISEKLCEKLKINVEKKEYIFYGALLHDIGKLFIPVHILEKKGTLNHLEYEKVKSHAILGESFISKLEKGDNRHHNIILNSILFHHERVDGSGYPYGLNSGQIPLEAKIIAVADAVDVMLHGRHYCDNKEIEVINIELNNNKNLQFDATVAQAMIEIMELNSDFEFKFDNSQMIKCYV